jgi:hypothetical protein
MGPRVLEGIPMKDGYYYVQPQIVGSAERWGYAFHSDLVPHDTVEEAYAHGMRTLGHDDFWVGAVSGGVFGALFGTMDGPFCMRVGEGVEDELAGVNAEFGLREFPRG